MKKHHLINQFTQSLIVEKNRKNKIETQDITSTMITAALSLAFVNESCKSSGKISKSQVIYRKVEGLPLQGAQSFFREFTSRFLHFLNIFSRNRKFIISFDTTKEAFYGEYSKAEDNIYLHGGSIAAESDFYYEYLTASITCNALQKYVLDAIIVPQGFYMEDYIKSTLSFLKELLPLEAILFDRGFDSWGVIYVLKQLKLPYVIFWKKQGEWYKEHLNKMQDGEFKIISREEPYKRHKSYYWVISKFVLVKQLEYEEKRYDWIFATNLKLKKAESYVKIYKKRWAIETIYRVTDDIRIYTTSTKSIIRYFLFMFTCLVYNIWRFFQGFIGEDFSLANFKTNMIIFLAKTGKIYPYHFNSFERQALKFLQ